VIEAPPVAGAEKPLNAFETLTLVPIDRRLIAVELMTTAELDWVDAYHARVAGALSEIVDTQTRDWLAAATTSLPASR